MIQSKEETFKNTKEAISINIHKLAQGIGFKQAVVNRNMKVAMQKLAKVLNKDCEAYFPNLKWKVSGKSDDYNISLVSAKYGDLMNIDDKPKMLSALEMIGVIDMTSDGYDYVGKHNSSYCKATGMSYFVNVVCDETDLYNPVRTIPKITGSDIKCISQTIANAQEHFADALQRVFSTDKIKIQQPSVNTKGAFTELLRTPQSKECVR